jgi:hypothetical protein
VGTPFVSGTFLAKLSGYVCAEVSGSPDYFTAMTMALIMGLIAGNENEMASCVKLLMSRNGLL